jgi:hypothetical protein
MRKQISILWEILRQAISSVVALVLFVLGSIDTAIIHFPFFVNFLGRLKTDYVWVSNALGWFSNNWLYFFLVAVSASIFEGFYRKTEKYISDPIRANITVTPTPTNLSENYVGVSIYNGEKLRITGCTVKIETATRVFGNSKGPINTSIGFPNKYIGPFDIISKDTKELWLARITLNHFRINEFVDLPPDDNGLEPGKYMIELRIFGDLDGRPIKPIDKTYQIEFHLGLTKYLQIQERRQTTTPPDASPAAPRR